VGATAADSKAVPGAALMPPFRSRPRATWPRTPGAAADGWLVPRHWWLEDEPPGPALLSSRADGAEAPVLLLIDRRQALAAGRMEQLAACLSHEERQRHQAYRLPADRQRFLLGRAALRRLLGAWLELTPEAVPLEAGPHGKPHCPIAPRFNLSHAGDLILLTLDSSRPVGVDVEQLRPDLDWPALARRLCSDAERRELERLPPQERPEAFLATWCRLEARLKARGTGLAGLEQLREEERQAEGPATTRERVWNVHVPSGYRGAVARVAHGDAAGAAEPAGG
jgi:4'-phosphopantetheinyl transferase